MVAQTLPALHLLGQSGKDLLVGSALVRVQMMRVAKIGKKREKNEKEKRKVEGTEKRLGLAEQRLRGYS